MRLPLHSHREDRQPDQLDRRVDNAEAVSMESTATDTIAFEDLPDWPDHPDRELARKLGRRYVGRHRGAPGDLAALWLRANGPLRLMFAFGITVSLTAAVSIATAKGAFAASPDAVRIVAAPGDLNEVIANIRGWLMGILVALATLFLTIGAVRYVAAGGDPGETERAKSAFKSAAVGYALAMLAPLVLSIVGGWVK